MRQSFSAPFPCDLSYFVGTWTHQHADEPIQFWYEVDESGSCLRQVERYRDGRMLRDAVANYPDGATNFGFGTLHGASFWESEWDDEPDGSGESTSILKSSNEEFEAAWASAG
jgi:hypothetical protein